MLTRPPDPLALLIAAPFTVDPALVLACAVYEREMAVGGPLPVEEMMPFAAQLDAALNEGETTLESARRTLQALQQAVPLPQATAPVGF